MAMRAQKGAEKPTEVDILAISQGAVELHIMGTSPLILNRMATKAKRELLLPRGRLTGAARAASVKHDPIAEFRDSVYRNADPNAKTRLKFPASGFKRAMATAALDLPGTKRSEIGRLVWVPGVHIDVYGIPQFYMATVRSADIARTPDIRTRAIVPEWCCKITVRYVEPKLNMKGIINLVAAAGVIAGIGDFRQEKGAGNFGQFEMRQHDDKEFAQLVKAGGAKAQDDALAHFTYFDADSEELFNWYQEEIIRRGKDLSVSLREAVEDDEEEGATTTEEGEEV